MFEFSDFQENTKCKARYYILIHWDNLRVILLSVMKLVGRFGQSEIGCKDQDDDEEEAESKFTSDNC